MLELLSAVLFCLVFLGSFVLIELTSRKFSVSPDITRRLAHVLSGLFAIFIWQRFSHQPFFVCLTLFMIAIIFSYRKRIVSSIHNVKRKTYGEIFLPLGLFFCLGVSLKNPEVFVPAILIMTFADVSAGIASDARQLNRQSKVGSICFFVVAVLVLVATGVTPIPQAIAVAAVATVVERISPYGSDNFTVPVAVSSLLLL